jgi:hypothetical protein
VDMMPDQVRAKTVKLVFVASLLCISQRLIGLDWGICITVYNHTIFNEGMDDTNVTN